MFVSRVDVFTKDLALERSFQHFSSGRIAALEEVYVKVTTEVFTTHMDTVQVGEGWTRNPFGGSVENGRVYGRGAADAKGALACFLAAMEALKSGGARLRGQVLLAAVVDEETASLGTRGLVRDLRCRYVIVGEPTLGRLVNAGQLTYGVAATFPPFEYQRGNDLAGFDIEMGRFLAEQMGLRTNILNINFDGLIPALQGGRVDLINSAMYINPERSTQVDFIPYMKVGESIVVLKGNPKNIRSLDDLSGKTVTVTRGAIEETYANQQNERFRAAGRPEMTIVAYPTGPDSILAVQQGRGDAFFTSSPGAAYIQEQVPDTFEIASTFAADTQIGMAVRRGDAEMKRALEAALDNFVRSGKYLETMRKYNLPQEGSLFP